MPADGTGRPTVVAGADPAVLAAVGRQVRAEGPLIAVGPAAPRPMGGSGDPAAAGTRRRHGSWPAGARPEC